MSKSFIGNPFTSQPMYIAACAFLAEAAQHASQPPSRSNTPPDRTSNPKASIDNEIKANPHKTKTAKHTLLAAAANQNYQRCYKALKMLDSYWAGCRYILTALDQKLKGLMDPLLFTQDDLDGDMPSTEPSFTTPGWRRTMSNSASMGGPVGTAALNRIRALGSSPNAPVWSPKLDHSQAIGWSLTGTTNSPAPNLSFLYQADNSKSGGMSPVLDARKRSRKERATSDKAGTYHRCAGHSRLSEPFQYDATTSIDQYHIAISRHSGEHRCGFALESEFTVSLSQHSERQFKINQYTTTNDASGRHYESRSYFRFRTTANAHAVLLGERAATNLCKLYPEREYPLES